MKIFRKTQTQTQSMVFENFEKLKLKLKPQKPLSARAGHAGAYK
jgi:hypothetical protein